MHLPPHGAEERIDGESAHDNDVFPFPSSPAVVPDAMIVRSPAPARIDPPLTGQSRKRIPRSAKRDAAEAHHDAETVDETITTDPSRIDDSRSTLPPPPPKHVDWHCDSSTSTISTTSVPRSTKSPSAYGDGGREGGRAWPAAEASE